MKRGAHLNETENRASCPATNADAELAGLPVVAVAAEEQRRLPAAATTAAAAITRAPTIYTG